MYVQRVKNILTEDIINPFSNEMDKTKLNITSGTYTSHDISECLLAIFERGKIREWCNSRKELLQMDAISISSIQQKEKNWKSFEDTIKRITKMKLTVKQKI